MLSIFQDCQVDYEDTERRFLFLFSFLLIGKKISLDYAKQGGLRCDVIHDIQQFQATRFSIIQIDPGKDN